MDRGSQLDEEDEEDEDEAGGGRGRQERKERKLKAADTKSNNPHLAGGEKPHCRDTVPKNVSRECDNLCMQSVSKLLGPSRHLILSAMAPGEIYSRYSRLIKS